MLNTRFIARQITGAKRQCALFVLCVALSMVTLVSLGSFSRSAQSSLLRDAQALHAADIIIHADPRGRAEPHGGAFAEVHAEEA